jgi:hypothetical protein
MAEIFAKQAFSLNKGEKRIPWRYKGHVDDNDILNFINKDPHFSQKERWRTVIDIFSFDDVENNEKFNKKLTGTSHIAIGNVELSDSTFVSNGKEGSTSFRQNLSNRGFDFERKQKINEFALMNDFEREDIVNEFYNSGDVDALLAIKEDLSDRGEFDIAKEIDEKVKTIDRKKAVESSNKAKQEILDALN